MNVHCDQLCDQLCTAFLDARPRVREVMDDDALFMEHVWDDLLHCWCGMPL